MPIPVDGRVLWLGAAATIPAGWSRDTSFDDLTYLQGSGSGFTGAVTTADNVHTHTQDAHSHIGGGHTHEFASGWSSGALSANVEVSGAPTMFVPGVVVLHQHGVLPSRSGVDTFTSDGAVTVSGDVTARPLSRSAVVMQPDDGLQGLPTGAVCWTDESVLPVGCSASAEMVGRFAVGAPAGAGGGTASGSGTHSHTSNPIHDHPIPGHEHPATTAGGGTTQEIKGGAWTRPYAERSHHRVEFLMSGAATSGTATPASDAASNDPSYVKLRGVERTAGGGDVPDGVVIAYTGDIATGGVPTGWVLMDGTGASLVDCSNVQVMGSVGGGDIGATGGSDAHGHVMASHVHTGVGLHNHGVTVTWFSAALEGLLGSGPVLRDSVHGHRWTVWQAGGGPSDGTSPGTSSDDGRRKHRTVVFLKSVPAEEVSQMPLAIPRRRRRRRRFEAVEV